MADVLNDLLEKLRVAKHGDVELDADVYEALGFRVIRRPVNPNGKRWMFFDTSSSRWVNIQNYSSDLNHIMNEVRRFEEYNDEKPYVYAWGMAFGVSDDTGVPFTAILQMDIETESFSFNAHTPSLALLGAWLQMKFSPLMKAARDVELRMYLEVDEEGVPYIPRDSVEEIALAIMAERQRWLDAISTQEVEARKARESSKNPIMRQSAMMVLTATKNIVHIAIGKPLDAEGKS